MISKRYRLLKDLPTFKAGDIFVLKPNGNLYWDASYQERITEEHSKHWSSEVIVYISRTLEKFPNILKDWFEEIKNEKYWCVDYIECGVDKLEYCPSDPSQDEFNKKIGNYFKTEDEAWEAVEKLKAWKRLKDKGFELDYIDEYENLCGNGFEIPVRFIMPAESYNDKTVLEDLRLVFGGNKDD